MEWIYVGVILNTILMAGFPTEEACLGHKAMLEKQKVAGTCINSPSSYSGPNITLSNPTYFPHCATLTGVLVPCSK